MPTLRIGTLASACACLLGSGRIGTQASIACRDGP